MDDKQATSFVKTELTWLQKHERLIIVFLVLVFGGWLGNKYLDNSAANTRTQLAIQQQVSAATASAASEAAKQYQMTIDALTRQNASLAASVVARQVVLTQKQTEIKTEPLPQVADEWNKLIGMPGAVISNITGFGVSDDAARATVSQLEEVPVLKANLADETKIAENTKTELNSCSVLVDARNKEIVENDKTCKAEVADVKAQARKSKRNWFIAGFITGIATRILGHF